MKLIRTIRASDRKLGTASRYAFSSTPSSRVRSMLQVRLLPALSAACLLVSGNAVAQDHRLRPAIMAPAIGTAPEPPSAPAISATPVPASKNWPRLLPNAKPAPPARWSQAEIDMQTARCVHMLNGLDIVAIPAPAIREGSECGAAAPMELISVGKSPQVSFSPPVVVTCDMVAALHRWVTVDLQGLAKQHLGSPLVRIETMSSYSCRNAYGRVKSRLSEHGRANAIDIRSFHTAINTEADLLADWGPTARDIQEQIAIARAAAQKAEAERALAAAKGAPAAVAAAPGAPTPVGVATAAPVPGPTVTSTLPTFGRPGLAVAFPSGRDASPAAVGLSTGMSRLGGPRQANSVASVPKKEVGGPAGRSQFLRGAHRSACAIFGTVLGPESNNAHRNHFHVDAAERTSGAFCE
jgi:hypothetical protein